MSEEPRHTDIQPVSIDFRRYIDVAYRKKWLIVFLFVPIFFGTLYYVHQQPEQYSSETTIYLDVAHDALTVVSLGEGGGRSSSRRPLEFYLGIFESRSFREQVRSDLTRYVKSLGMSESQAVEEASAAVRSLSINRASHSGYYRISAQASFPDIAFAADSIGTHLFLERCRQVSQHESDAMLRFITEQFDSTSHNLMVAEDALQDFRNRHNLLKIGSAAATSEPGLPVEYVRLIEGYYEARAQRQAAQANLVATERTAELIEQTLASVADDPILRGPPARELREVQERARQARMDLQIKEFQEQSFADQLRNYEAANPNLQNISLTYLRLGWERDIHERLQTLLMQRREELRIRASSETGGVSIIDPPSPGTPVPSKARRTLILGAVLGLAFGFGVAYFWDSMDTSVKSVSELPQTLGITAIGAVPRVGESRRRSKARRSDGMYAELISDGSPKDPIAESYRALRTSLVYSTPDQKLKSLVVSSPAQAEGKSYTTANLGIACAQMGQKTVIVDGDLRRSMQHTLFGLERDGGLSEFILGDLQLADVVKPSGVEGLDIISAGISPPNPAPLLGSDAMRSRLEELTGAYDLVLFDTPPIIAVTDAVLLGRLTDGVLLVIRCASTPMAAAKHAVSVLTNANIPVLGGILNDVDVSRHYGGYYYYNYYYRYSYGGYYGDGDEKTQKSNVKA